MNMLFEMTLIDILVVGIVANIITDVYELILERVLGKMRDWHLVGRWMINIPRGNITLNRFDNTPAMSGELAMGWIIHYVVGVLFAAIYLLGVHLILSEHPTIGSAIWFGVITVAAPWLILMPALGVGIFASKAERPNFVRIMSLSVHVVFGLGLYVGAVVTGLTQ